MRAIVLVLAVVALAGCESTQAKSARLERAAQTAKKEKGLVVAQESRDVVVERTTVLSDEYGAALVVELRNRSAGSLVALPIATEVRDAAAKNVYSNDAPGLDASLVAVPSLAPQERLAWVNDQVTLAGEGRDVVARVGAGAKPGPAELPVMQIRGLKTSSDASGDLAVIGDVTNTSSVEQRRLVVFVVGRRGEKVVSAGRAVVERLAPGKSARFSAFPIGDPEGAELGRGATHRRRAVRNQMSRTPPPSIDAPPRAAAAQPPPGTPAPARTTPPQRAPTHAPPSHAGPAQPEPAHPAPARAVPTHPAPSPAAADAPLFVPRLASEPEPCASCGALLAPDQRYCLSCGDRRGSLRVPFPTAPAPAAASAPAPVARAPRRRSALPQSALSALYGLAGAAALGLGLLAGALIVQANDDPAPQAALALTAQPTATAATAAPTATPTAAAPAPATFTPDWPAGQKGWTVQLQTLPKDGTTPEAVATAKADATAGGAADVGALDSDAFGTLDGGNYVIYSGVATSKQDAETAKEGLIANFPDATVVEVADKATEEAPVTESQEDLKQKEEKQTPEDAQKNTRKAPPTVESEGTPPPADDEEPGAGSDATEIG